MLGEQVGDSHSALARVGRHGVKDRHDRSVEHLIGLGAFELSLKKLLSKGLKFCRVLSGDQGRISVRVGQGDPVMLHDSSDSCFGSIRPVALYVFEFSLNVSHVHSPYDVSGVPSREDAIATASGDASLMLIIGMNHVKFADSRNFLEAEGAIPSLALCCSNSAGNVVESAALGAFAAVAINSAHRTTHSSIVPRRTDDLATVKAPARELRRMASPVAPKSPNDAFGAFELALQELLPDRRQL